MDITDNSGEVSERRAVKKSFIVLGNYIVYIKVMYI